MNNGIPFVPENTIDPAAGLNESLLTVDALLQLAVVSVGDNAPPGSPANGARYVVGTAPTGAWAGRANQVAQWLDGGWRFYQARYALNTADGLMYVRQGATWGVAPAEWTAETVSQPDAEAGAATTRRAWTAQRVRQAIVAWWNSVSSTWGRGFVSSADAAAGRTALGLGTAATRTALGTTGALYSRDSILGTVSQSGGIPTGAIIERGSNANGSFVKYADGTMVCTNTINNGAVAYTAAGSVAVSSEYLWTYPVQFVEPPRVAGVGSNHINNFQWLSVSLPNANAVPYRTLIPSVSSASNSTVDLIAWGRWF